MAVPQTQWMSKAVRIPPEMEEALLSYARENGFMGPTGDVNWGSTIRSLLAYALDDMMGTGLDQQLLTFARNAQASALSHVRKVVLRALEDSKEDW